MVCTIFFFLRRPERDGEGGGEKTVYLYILFLKNGWESVEGIRVSEKVENI